LRDLIWHMRLQLAKRIFIQSTDKTTSIPCNNSKTTASRL